MRKILLVNPSARGDYLIAPYLWLCLKSHYQEFGKHRGSWEWLKPVYDVDYLSFENLLASIIEQKPNVVGFSMFLWNAKLNHRLGEEIKKALPDTLIIAGGPHLAHRYNPTWFEDHPWVDLICNPEGYGEEFMTKLLDDLSEEKRNYSEVPNAIYPDGHQWTKSPLLTDKRAFVWPSSLVAGSESYLKDLSDLAKFTKKKLFFAWETLRGCPYGCVYCEWGGGIMSKMNIKPAEIIERELKFLYDLDVHTLHINDPNFGILKRDLEVAQSIVDLANVGKLKRVWLGGKNKNNKVIVEQIDRMFLDSGLAQDGYQVSVNALDEKQLKAISRTNLSVDEHIEMVRRIRATYEIDADFELILGLPEANLQTIFDEYDIYDRADLWTTERFPWALLPETPAAHPDYIAKYKIKTVPAAAQIDDNFVQSNLSESTYNLLRDPRFNSTYDVVIETHSYNSQDWIEMLLVDNFVRTVECSGFTPVARKWLREHGIPASVFFKKLWDAFKNHRAVEQMRQQIRRFTQKEVGFEDGYLWFRSEYDPSRQIKMEAAFNLIVLHEPDALFNALRVSFPDFTAGEFGEILNRAETSVIRDNIRELSTQVMAPKVRELSAN
jgi:putative methyltransferase